MWFCHLNWHSFLVIFRTIYIFWLDEVQGHKELKKGLDQRKLGISSLFCSYSDWSNRQQHYVSRTVSFGRETLNTVRALTLPILVCRHWQWRQGTDAVSKAVWIRKAKEQKRQNKGRVNGINTCYWLFSCLLDEILSPFDKSPS